MAEHQRTAPEHLTPIGASVWRALRRLRPSGIAPSVTYADGSQRWHAGRWSLYLSPPTDGRRTVIAAGPGFEASRYRSGGSYARIGGRRVL